MTATTTSDTVAWMTAHDLVEAFAARSLSPVEVAAALLDRIDRVDADIGAWCFIDADTTMAQARASEARWQAGEPVGLIDGVPVAVKDVFLTEGWPTRKGSASVDAAGPWPTDAPVVAALRRHGAVLLGKTTTPELGWKGVTDAPAYGITRNPWDPTTTPGGSSGGSSAALMSGTVPLALGTDGGGSIRIPAGFSGHPGIKPTWGRVPLWPPSPYGSLAHAGPMARTVADTALFLDVLAEPDPRDAGALLPDDVVHRTALAGGIAGLRIAFSPDLGFVDVDKGVAEAVRTAVDVLADAGAHVEVVDPGFDDPLSVYERLWNAGAAQATATLSQADRERLDPGLAAIIDHGSSLSAVDYLNAAALRSELSVLMSLFHTTYDLLVTPTLPITAFTAGRDVPVDWPDHRWPTWTPFSYPFNLTQQPAATVPCGFVDGLPVGLQIVGPRGADAGVLRAAATYEERSPFTGRRPDAYA